MSVSADTPGEHPFRARAVLWVLAVGILGFLGTLVLGTFAPDLRSGADGGAHALSNGATGFSGIVRLAQATGRNALVVRDDAQLLTEDLVVLTPPSGATDLTAVLAHRPVQPTLIVLPKWLTAADPQRSGWVRYLQLVPAWDPARTLAPDTRLVVRRHASAGRPLRVANFLLARARFTAPRPLQVMAGAGIRPLLTDGQGGIVVGQVGDKPLYVLADPDLLSNKGLRDPANAAAALALLDWMNATGREVGIDFDVTLNGLGHSHEPAETRFRAAVPGDDVGDRRGAGAGGPGTRSARFGPVQPAARARSRSARRRSSTTAAALVRKAGRESRAWAPRYVAAIRDRARAVCSACRRDCAGPPLDAVSGPALNIADALQRRWRARRPTARRTVPALVASGARALHRMAEGDGALNVRRGAGRWPTAIRARDRQRRWWDRTPGRRHHADRVVRGRPHPARRPAGHRQDAARA